MEHVAVKILNRNRLMAISTVRPDGWPQTTMVGYVNRGFDVFFLIFRSGQKYANIQMDDRVSIAVSAEASAIEDVKAVYAGGHAVEITDKAECSEIWRRFMERSSNLWGFKIPEAKQAAFMRMRCKYVSVLDFSQGLGHREELVLDDDGVPVESQVGVDEWAEEGSPAR
jgi:nitroimidazol reductase NimA-like FMN-containing flavoprotein (pyridoxamine 5'-phosphate oxidase superfamily)